MNLSVKEQSPGITDVPGFSASGVACDIRGTGDDRLDLGLILSEKPCTGAGVFTLNDVVAAPVDFCKSLLSPTHVFHGIVANSGNANACTGEQGEKDCAEMATIARQALSLPPNSVFVASTGRIGRELPMEKVRGGIRESALRVTRDSAGGHDFANSILTSDTRSKTVTVRIEEGSKRYTVSGVGKGAGMIEPNMATMLAFLATDFVVPQATLQATLTRAVHGSFNRISVDGDMSTNDTVLLLANGASGTRVDDNADLLDAFHRAVGEVCNRLARMIVGDGERINHVVTLSVTGAPSDEEAEKVARCVGNSLLVKTSWFGNDPNWGRIVDAAGYARVGIDYNKVDMDYGPVPVMRRGAPQTENLPLWKKEVEQREFTVNLNLNLGKGSFQLLTTDLSEGYVDFNKSE
ncbi:MAG: bifunctional glutamate N-acetyltransferase/amino-acid acetyltransferase ArgJ [Verrucomicrobiota bacterium]